MTHAERTGLLIVFEGCEGTGKTTQTALLADALRANLPGREILVTHEPGATDFGQRIRDMVLSIHTGPMDPRAETMLYLANRADHVAEVIRPALARGAVVVSDRYEDSTIVYQGHARGLGAGRVEEMSRWATQNLTPDMVIVLDIDPAAGLARAGNRSAADRLEAEGLAFHRRVRDGYLIRVKWMQDMRRNDSAWDGVYPPTPWYFLVGAETEAADVAARVWQYVSTLLQERAPSHCGHWLEGDGACCRCGQPNWCPDAGETPEAIVEMDRAKYVGCHPGDCACGRPNCCPDDGEVAA